MKDLLNINSTKPEEFLCLLALHTEMLEWNLAHMKPFLYEWFVVYFGGSCLPPLLSAPPGYCDGPCAEALVGPSEVVEDSGL